MTKPIQINSLKALGEAEMFSARGKISELQWLA